MDATTPVGDFLVDGRLDRLRNGYDRTGMVALLAEALPRVYAPSRPYVDAIVATFYAGSAEPLAAADRERCLIALEAARGGRFTLAVHVYVGLMEGLSPAEVAHVLLLAGVYAGVDRFATAVDVERGTLAVLERLIAGGGSLDVATVFGALRAAFPA